VVCAARDGSGNEASATFVVHVRGAAEQLARLADAVVGVGPGTSLADKVAQARVALASGNRAETGSILRAFANQVTAQNGKTIVVATAATLTATAARIIAVLG
jgi:hypothetical protein